MKVRASRAHSSPRWGGGPPRIVTLRGGSAGVPSERSLAKVLQTLAKTYLRVQTLAKTYARFIQKGRTVRCHKPPQNPPETSKNLQKYFQNAPKMVQNGVKSSQNPPRWPFWAPGPSLDRFLSVFWSILTPFWSILGTKMESKWSKKTIKKSSCISNLKKYGFYSLLSRFWVLFWLLFCYFFVTRPKRSDMRFVSVFTIRIEVRASQKRAEIHPKSTPKTESKTQVR